jgi:xylulokinase
MKENGFEPSVIRVGRANMFLSDLFATAFVNTTNIPVELYDSDGSVGAAIGAGIGAGIYSSTEQAFRRFKMIGRVDPSSAAAEYQDLYNKWKIELLKFL